MATRRARIEDKVAVAGTDEGDPADEGPLTVDEGVRAGSTYEKLASLPPCFVEGGLVTAASSSQISDGAAAVLIMSEERAGQLGLTPRARFHTFAVAANDPVIMLTAPIPATTLVLEKAKLSLDDIDLIEINEAFASVVLAWEKEHHPGHGPGQRQRGAIAIGHPTGGSGARLWPPCSTRWSAPAPATGSRPCARAGGRPTPPSSSGWADAQPGSPDPAPAVVRARPADAGAGQLAATRGGRLGVSPSRAC